MSFEERPRATRLDVCAVISSPLATSCDGERRCAGKLLRLFQGSRVPGFQGPFPSGDLIDKAKVLDNFYIATRYANGHPKEAPFEH